MFEGLLEKIFGSKKKFTLKAVVEGRGSLKEYWACVGKDESVSVSLEQALDIARAFVTEKNITVPVSYEGRLINNHSVDVHTCQEKNFFSRYVGFRQRCELIRDFGERFDKVPVILSYSFPGDYQVSLTFSEGAEAHTENIYIDSQNGKIRTCGYFGGKESEITADYVAKRLAHERQYYVLMYVKDGQIADGVLGSLKEKEGVEAIHYGPRELIENDFADAAFSRLREGCENYRSPLFDKVKTWKK